MDLVGLINYRNKNYCVTKIYLQDESNLVGTLCSDDTNKTFKTSLSNVYWGYTYNSDTKEINQVVATSLNNYNFLFAQSGLLFGFLVLFFLIKIILNYRFH